MSKEKKVLEKSFISEARRIQLMGHHAVVWFTGLSGSGKSSLAKELEILLHTHGIHTYWLDGDDVRKGLNSDLSFNVEDRNENLRRIGEVSKLFRQAGIVTICSFITPLESQRTMLKNIIGRKNFVEIFVDTPIEECERRDVKGLYKKARNGEIQDFTGISSPYEIPKDPDLIIKTLSEDCKEASQRIFRFLVEEKRIKTI